MQQLIIAIVVQCFYIMSYLDSIQKVKGQIDSVNEFINLIEKNSNIFKSVGISVIFKGQTII